MLDKIAGLALQVDATSRMTIINPITRQPLRSEDGEEAWVDLLASSSKIGQTHDRGVMDRQLRTRGARYTAEQAEADTVEKLAKLTKGWRLVTLDGAVLDVPFTAGNARDLYTMPALAWLTQQVAEYVADLGNYRPMELPS